MTLTSEPLDWDGAVPRSRRYDDVYFSAVDGLAETRAVFLRGCGLPERWSDRRRFVVGEIGFGTGLNILALLDLWRRNRPRGGLLHIFTIEANLMDAGDAARALSVWPEVADLAADLIAGWPERRPGFQRLAFPGLGAVLDIAVMEAGEALAAWRGAADAWFLDGFAPAKNPDAWREEVLSLVAARSAPAACAATFTVAGAVRRGLESAGFAVDKRPGFGRKRERLEARLEGAPEPDLSGPRVAVIGAGIGGAALVHALRAAGANPRLFEAERPGAGASGAPSALVAMRLDAGGGPPAQLHVQALQRARDVYRAAAPLDVLAEGTLQLEGQPRDSARFDRLAAWEGFAPGAVHRLDAEAVAERLGEPAGAGGLALRDSLVVQPAVLIAALLGEVEPETIGIEGLERSGAGWRLLGRGGAVIADVDVICLAAGAANQELIPKGVFAPPLRPVRGQVSWASEPFPGPPAAWGGYAAPTPGGGTLFGATHDRDDTGTDVRPDDHARNLTLLAKGRPSLATCLSAGEALQGWAGVRAATPDHLPVAGRLAPGLMILGGLGGRGFTLAPLLAEHVAAVALGVPSPLPEPLATAVDPLRFSDEPARRRPPGD